MTAETRRLVRGGLILLTTLALMSIAAEYEPQVSTTIQVANEKFALRFFRNPKILPPLILQTIDGRTIPSAEWRGKVTLVNFWATWCLPCKAEIPELIALQEKYPDDLRIIGVSEDSSTDLVKRFVSEQKINYSVAMATPDIRHAFPGVVGLPTSFVVDRQARIVQKHVGLLNPTRTEHEVRALAGR